MADSVEIENRVFLTRLQIGAYSLAIVLSYLTGSLPTGYLAGMARGIDIRAAGSGNIGATNVFRILGKTAGIAVLAVDGVKGFAAARWVPLLAEHCFPGVPRENLALAAGAAAVLGHVYSCWLKFKGGKGIATSAGALGAILPWVMLVSLLVWIAGVLLTRTVSVGSLLAAASLPLAAAWFYPHQWVYFGFTAFAGGLAAWRHRSNMERLLAGTESKVNLSKKKDAA